MLWNGEVVEGYVSPPQRDAADTAALRRYNTRLASDTRLLTTFLPVGDGVALSVKLERIVIGHGAGGRAATPARAREGRTRR